MPLDEVAEENLIPLSSVDNPLAQRPRESGDLPQLPSWYREIRIAVEVVGLQIQLPRRLTDALALSAGRTVASLVDRIDDEFRQKMLPQRKKSGRPREEEKRIRDEAIRQLWDNRVDRNIYRKRPFTSRLRHSSTGWINRSLSTW
jgi:hypothetical protein